MSMFDVAVVGGGILGVATARELALSGRRVVVLEKESSLAAHQSGRNSGVLHTGVYYQPGSAKALNCRAGYAAMLAFCRSEEIPYDLCGKVIVATSEDELPRLEELERRGIANGVRLERIDAQQLHDLEPHAAGVAALHVPDAGITGYGDVVERMAEHARARGADIRLGARVTRFRRAGSWQLELAGGDTVEAGTVVNCAGLYSDRVARLAGADPGHRIVPFRGEYYEVLPEASHLCRGLIYPVPDPSFPFLGVHFTRMISGGLECGPNAVLALAREGYDWGRFSPRDLSESLTWPGFIRLASRHWRTGFGEVWRSLNKAAFVRSLQRLVPEIRAEHLRRAPAGVRAQALARDGSLVEDFVIVRDEGMVHVCNAPSPAATSSLAIARRIVSEVEKDPAD